MRVSPLTGYREAKGMILAFDLASFNQVLIDLTDSSKWKPGDNAWEKLWQFTTAVTCSVSLGYQP